MDEPDYKSIIFKKVSILNFRTRGIGNEINYFVQGIEKNRFILFWHLSDFFLYLSFSFLREIQLNFLVDKQDDKLLEIAKKIFLQPSLEKDKSVRGFLDKVSINLSLMSNDILINIDILLKMINFFEIITFSRK